jgi:hypothetical protein
MSHGKKHHYDHRNTQDNPPQSTSPAHATTSANTNTPNSEGHQGQEDEQQKPSRKLSNPDWWMVWLTGFLGLAAFATFWVLWCQLNDARQAFVKDQRPYVWLASGEKKVSWARAGSKQIGIAFHYTNFGKSPALRLHYAADLELGSDAVLKIDERKKLAPDYSILPTGKEDVAMIVSDPNNPLSEDQIREYTAPQNKSEMVIFVRFQYEDVSGHAYESDICAQYWGNIQNWGYCSDHNAIKDCSKEKCED